MGLNYFSKIKSWNLFIVLRIRSGYEIVPMEIQNLYINKESAIKDYSFREAKMYGTIFNYLGYMANAGYNNGCCVPQFTLDTLHNPIEKRSQENECQN